jgi:hypothetical protein
MNSRDLLIVLIRISLIAVGLYLLGLALLSMPAMLVADNVERSYMLALAGIVLLALVLFWVFARQLASMLLPKSSQDNVVTTATFVPELTRSALCIIAVYYITSALASLPILILFLGSGNTNFNIPGGESLSRLFVLAPIGDLLIGILLLFFANRIAKRISNKSQNEPTTNAL